MSVCVVCWNPFHQCIITRLFGPRARNYMERLLNCKVPPNSVCYVCSVKAASASHMFDAAVLRKQYANPSSPSTCLCFLCLTPNDLQLYKVQEFELINYTLHKLTDEYLFNKPIYACINCNALVVMFNKIVQYHFQGEHEYYSNT